MQAFLFGLWAVVLSAAAAVAAEPLAKGIQDNSFLIEEAYNQEAGHVQHIVNLRRQGQQWQFSFSQEWPIFSQTHQFSYTVPYNFGSSRGRRYPQLPLPSPDRDRHASGDRAARRPGAAVGRSDRGQRPPRGPREILRL